MKHEHPPVEALLAICALAFVGMIIVEFIFKG
jgi:hypothetical protein